MCTHIVLKNKGGSVVSARTMDFSLELDPEMGIVPRNYPMKFNHLGDVDSHYGFMGLTKNVGTYAFADGVNEHGLSCAALYFEGYASYNDEVLDGRVNLSSHEFLHYVLASYKTVEEVKSRLGEINIVNDRLDFIGMPAPLHWVIVDETGASVVVEPLKKELDISENIVGVLTNSPDLTWHTTNLRNYIGLQVEQVEPRTINGVEFKPFGQGSGTFGLLGDHTPPSRFVRTVYAKLSCQKGEDKEGLLISAINILNGVTIPKGSVVTQRNSIDYTQYISYASLKEREYYFKTYSNNGLTKLSLADFDLDGEDLYIYKVDKDLIFGELR